MKHIDVGNGLISMIDDIDYDMISCYNWSSYKSKTTGTYIPITRIVKNGKWATIRMHSLIVGDVDKYDVDHINHNTLDNRRSNLRLCSRSENLMNRRMFRNNISGYKGVSFNTQHNKWMAKVVFNKHQYFCGYFDNPEDASVAYDNKLITLCNEFALTNKDLREREVNGSLHTTDKTTQKI